MVTIDPVQPVVEGAAPTQQKINIFMKLNFQTRILIIIAAVLITIILILLILPKPKPPALIVPTPPPISTISATLIPRLTSEFSKTEEFLSFERNLGAVRADTEKLELTETKLSFPFLDMQLNFGE